MSLKDKTAIITGGTKGIGLAIAESMLENGMKVAITGRTKSSVDQIVNQLDAKYPGHVIGLASDVRNLTEEINVANQVIQQWGKLDVLIANAGIGHFASIDELDSESWSEVIDVNLTGVFNSVKASVEHLKKSKGYIFTIASLAGTNFFAKGAAYNASKFGLVGFSQAIMLDLRNYGVKVSTIMPGSVSTYFNNHQPSEADSWKIQPEDLGKLVIDLLTMHPRTLPSKVEVRPTIPQKK